MEYLEENAGERRRNAIISRGVNNHQRAYGSLGFYDLFQPEQIDFKHLFIQKTATQTIQ
ncbi:MAG TPA: hypothetical protein PK580_08790 [Nitrosomonas halophila]|nr:hypothetical protein [Nitrosomonas halophila]